MKLSDTTLKALAPLLDAAGEQFSNRGCSDLPSEVVESLKHLPPEDQKALQVLHQAWNYHGAVDAPAYDTEEDGEIWELPDWSLLYMLAHYLKNL